MAVVTILEEQTVVYDEENGCLIVATNPLVVDETYTVAWNGVEYECVAFGFESGAGFVTTAIGNQVVVNDEDNGMPFTIAYADAENSGLGTPGYEIVFLDGSTTATLAIYQAANDEEPEEPEEEEPIVLKDRNGNDIFFQGINMLRVKTPSGGTKTFAACDDVEKTVDPDFSDGDFVVLPDTGTLLSKVTVEKPEALSPENIRKGKRIAGVTGDFIGDTESVTVELALADGDQTVSPSADGKVISGVTIKKPETLTPANIAKGVEVAGVTGSLEVPETVETSVELDFSGGDMVVTPEDGQAFSAVNIPVPGTLIPENIAGGVDIAGIIGTLVGGGGSVASKFVSKKPTSDPYTITHGLGVVPDIVIGFPTNQRILSSGDNLIFIGCSTAFHNKAPNFPLNLGFYVSTYLYYNSGAEGIDGTDTTMPMYNANANTITIRNNSTLTHSFYFIGGLT